MGLHTPRNGCLACGRFWILDGTPNACPYCSDQFYFDNVISNVPPALGRHDITCDGCGAKFAVETNDAKWCVMCRKEFKVEGGISQMDYQISELEKLGI